MNLCKNKVLNILLNILIIVILPLIAGFLFAMYFEYFIVPLLIIPGFIAFFGEALNNGANMN